MNRMRIEGVYDLRTLKTLSDNGINDFGFDFRPTSFNFLQQYKFMELLAQNDQKDFKYHLHFCNEADFVIKKFLDDLKSSYKSEDNLFQYRSKFSLEFSDHCRPRFYDAFETPYYWNFHQEVSLNDMLNSKYLKGIIFDYAWLHQKHEKGEFDSFFAYFLQAAGRRVREKNIEIGLKVDWDSHLFASLFDYVNFNFLSLPVNEKIEVCYRNVDLSKASKNIHFYKTLNF